MLSKLRARGLHATTAQLRRLTSPSPPPSSSALPIRTGSSHHHQPANLCREHHSSLARTQNSCTVLRGTSISARQFSSASVLRSANLGACQLVDNIYAARNREALTIISASGYKMPLSNVDLMREADAFPYPDKPSEAEHYKSLTSNLYTLKWTQGGQILGYMRPDAVDALVAVPEDIRGPVVVDRESRTLHAFEHLPTEPERTALVGRVMSYWREQRAFRVLEGWRDELWPVYGSATEVLYSVERSAAGLLGVLRHGVHMMAYVLRCTTSSSQTPSASDGGSAADEKEMRIWIPRRSPTKQTYPGMLDNTVAGGFMTGEVPFECMVREADEEASLPETLVRERARERGIVTYIHITDERAGGEAGQIYPEMQWVYDIELPEDVIPTPKDGEVAGFQLMSVAEVKAELGKGSFKPNCALVLVDFFVRHGIINRDKEPDYDEIVARLHRKLPIPGPHLLYAPSSS